MILWLFFILSIDLDADGGWLAFWLACGLHTVALLPRTWWPSIYIHTKGFNESNLKSWWELQSRESPDLLFGAKFQVNHGWRFQLDDFCQILTIYHGKLVGSTSPFHPWFFKLVGLGVPGDSLKHCSTFATVQVSSQRWRCGTLRRRQNFRVDMDIFFFGNW